MPQHLKCLDTVIYDLPLITILVSNCHLFSDITMSQGSVATCSKCGGILSYHFTANLLPVKISQSYHYEFGGPLFLEHSYQQHQRQTFSKKSTAESFLGGLETCTKSSDPEAIESKHITYATSDSRADSAIHKTTALKIINRLSYYICAALI